MCVTERERERERERAAEREREPQRARSLGSGLRRAMNTDSSQVDNPMATNDVEKAAVDEEVAPKSKDEEIEPSAGPGFSHMGVAAVMAHLGAAPTNWHQATVYFLTSKAEDDAAMRKKAPLMFVCGVGLVVVQIASLAGMLGAMLHPACTSNAHCDGRRGFYCYTRPGREQGN